MSSDRQGDAVIWLSLVHVWYTQLAIFRVFDTWGVLGPGFLSVLLTDLSKWTQNELLQKPLSLLEQEVG